MSQFHGFSAEKWRKLFPVTAHSVYVNHAACSPVSTRVRSRVEKLLDESSTNAVDNSGILSFRSYLSEYTKNIFDFLIKNHIICSYCEGMIRISPHFYNSESEMTEILHCVKIFLKR